MNDNEGALLSLLHLKDLHVYYTLSLSVFNYN